MTAKHYMGLPEGYLHEGDALVSFGEARMGVDTVCTETEQRRHREKSLMTLLIYFVKRFRQPLRLNR
jgi:hypothetical protein